jgi:hypothetical protein
VGLGLSWPRMVYDLVHFLCLGLRSRTSLAAENLFLRKQFAFYQERKVKPAPQNLIRKRDRDQSVVSRYQK